MRRTLLYIPEEIYGVPVFGFGIVFFVFLGVAAILVVDKIRRRGLDGESLGAAAFYAVMAAAIGFLSPNIVEQGDGLPIRGYGVMVMIAVVAGVWLAVRRARQAGANPDIIFSLGLWMILLGLAGARLLYVAEYFDEFRRPTAGDTLGAVLNITKGGLVIYGGLMGAAVAFFWRTYKHKLPTLALADMLVASMALGQGIGRLGCFLNGCCYGGVCTAPELPAVRFPWGSPPHVRHVQRGEVFLHGIKLPGGSSPPVIEAVEPGSAAEKAGLAPGMRIVRIGAREDAPAEAFFLTPTAARAKEILLSVDGQPGRNHLTIVTSDDRRHALGSVTPAELSTSLPVHPTQLYSAVNGVLVALFLWAVYPFRRREGETLAWGLTIFPVTRFLMEWVRVDEPQNFFLGMTISQTISVCLFLTGLALWAWLGAQPRRLLTPADWSEHNRRWAKSA